MEQLQNLTKYDMPEVSEMITKYFSSNKEKPSTSRAVKQAKKENKRNWVTKMRNLYAGYHNKKSHYKKTTYIYKNLLSFHVYVLFYVSTILFCT